MGVIGGEGRYCKVEGAGVCGMASESAGVLVDKSDSYH
jgi:hypothetical protein